MMALRTMHAPPWKSGPQSCLGKYSLASARSLLVQATRAKLLLARVICSVDIVKLQGRLPMNLHCDLANGHCIVVHVRIEKCKATGRKTRHLSLLKNISHPDLQFPSNYRYVLPH